jgi:hypothetical protein
MSNQAIKYSRENLELDQDCVSGGDIIDCNELDRIIADANRYHYLKTATSGFIGWHDGWLCADDSDEWDSMIDGAIE